MVSRFRDAAGHVFGLVSRIRATAARDFDTASRFRDTASRDFRPANRVRYSGVRGFGTVSGLREAASRLRGAATWRLCKRGSFRKPYICTTWPDTYWIKTADSVLGLLFKERYRCAIDFLAAKGGVTLYPRSPSVKTCKKSCAGHVKVLYG